MLDPPKLAEADLRDALRRHYGLSVETLTFLPIGNDAATFVYRVAAGGDYFLKLRTAKGFRVASVEVPRFLIEGGVAHVAAPLPAAGGSSWARLADFYLALYPFLEARPAADVGLGDDQWRAFGDTVRRIHAAELPEELRRLVPRETYVPFRRELLPQIEAVCDAGRADPIAQELIHFWRGRRTEIRAVVARADALGEEMRQAASRPVLCHADLHTWNVLVDAAGRFFLVDWDEVVYAPKERDLMFVIGGIAVGLVDARQTEQFLRGYGATAIDARAIAYYRYAWAVQDIAAYAEQALLDAEASETTRRAALQAFIGLFAPGNIVSIATAGEVGSF